MITKCDASPRLGTIAVGGARPRGDDGPVLGLHVVASLALAQQAVVVLDKVGTHSGMVCKLDDGHARRQQSTRSVLYII